MIIKEQVLEYCIYIDSNNCSFSFDYKRLDSNSIDFGNISNYKFEDYNTSSVAFCINISNGCNLKCDYCFNTNKNGSYIDYSVIIKFLDLCFESYPDKEKYYVDLSGKGEPLLHLDMILKIKKYCVEKSNDINREILVSFVSNGTLLTKDISEILQKNGILFGVSLDGNKLIHDKHRKTKSNGNTYELIIDNVKNIKRHEYVGCATTLTKDVFSLVDSLKELSETFNTIGYKPVRNCNESFDNDTIDLWMKEYDKLAKFLLDETIKTNDKYIITLLNGDDYFGKYIKRLLLNQRCFIRCDGGLSRITLNDDKKIYICPAASGIEELCIGDINHIDNKRQQLIFDKQLNKIYCFNCDVKYLCGGECLIEQYLLNHNNVIMCKYKKHLILLAMYFTLRLKENNEQEFFKLQDFAKEISLRNRIDIKLDLFLKENPNLKFTEGKKIYDEMNRKY